MKFTLKDYQIDAVRDVLDRLKKARKRWHEDADKNAFSLTAVTGAGKTVIATNMLWRLSQAGQLPKPALFLCDRDELR